MDISGLGLAGAERSGSEVISSIGLTESKS